MQEVIIHELLSRVRTLDSDSVLAPVTFTRIVQAVLEAVREDTDHQRRVAEEHTLDNYQEFTAKRRA